MMLMRDDNVFLAAIAKARDYYEVRGGNVGSKYFNEKTSRSQFEIRQWGVILCKEQAPAWQFDIEAFENAWLGSLVGSAGLDRKPRKKRRSASYRC